MNNKLTVEVVYKKMTKVFRFNVYLLSKMYLESFDFHLKNFIQNLNGVRVEEHFI